MTNVIYERLSPNRNSRPAGMPISLIVLHHTAGHEAGDLDRMTDPSAKVSAHYYVTKAPKIYQLVRDIDRAWHAGKSVWRGQSDVNDFSLGIELENLGTGADPWPDRQIAVVAELVASKLKAYKLTKQDVTDHKTIAPGRKSDLAQNFPWGLFWKEVDKHLAGDGTLYNLYWNCSSDTVGKVVEGIRAAGYTPKPPPVIPVVVYNADDESRAKIKDKLAPLGLLPTYERVVEGKGG